MEVKIEGVSCGGEYLTSYNWRSRSIRRVCKAIVSLGDVDLETVPV